MINSVVVATVLLKSIIKLANISIKLSTLSPMGTFTTISILLALFGNILAVVEHQLAYDEALVLALQNKCPEKVDKLIPLTASSLQLLKLKEAQLSEGKDDVNGTTIDTEMSTIYCTVLVYRYGIKTPTVTNISMQNEGINIQEKYQPYPGFYWERYQWELSPEEKTAKLDEATNGLVDIINCDPVVSAKIQGYMIEEAGLMLDTVLERFNGYPDEIGPRVKCLFALRLRKKMKL